MNFKYLCVVVVFILLQDGVHSDPGCKKNCKLCPSYNITGDLKNITVLMSFERKLALDVWQSPLIPQLSMAATKLIDIIKLMANTDFPYFVNIAYQFSSWSTALIPFNEGCEKMCFIATLVNASLEWELNKNKNLSSEALLEWSKSIPGACHLISQVALQVAGCPMLPDLPPLNTPKCYKNGFVYDIKKAFKLFGKLLPCEFKKASLILYNSTDYMDKLIVGLAVATFSPIQLDIFNIHPPQYLFETVALALNGNISRCCCPIRTKRLVELCKIATNIAAANAQILIKDKYQYDECANYT